MLLLLLRSPLLLFARMLLVLLPALPPPRVVRVQLPLLVSLPVLWADIPF